MLVAYDLILTQKLHFIHKKYIFFGIVLEFISLYFFGNLNMFVRFYKNLVNISITLNFFHMKINGQHSGLNIIYK
jgi:hypothetical protein